MTYIRSYNSWILRIGRIRAIQLLAINGISLVIAGILLVDITTFDYERGTSFVRGFGLPQIFIPLGFLFVLANQTINTVLLFLPLDYRYELKVRVVFFFAQSLVLTPILLIIISLVFFQ